MNDSDPDSGQSEIYDRFIGPVVAAGAVIFREGKLLLVRRSNPPEANRWGIPGGKVRTGENLHDAVVREVLEETGLRVQVTDRFWVAEGIGPGNPAAWHFVFLDFLAEIVEGNAEAGDDASELEWVSPTDLEGIPLASGMGNLLSKIRPIWNDRISQEGRQ